MARKRRRDPAPATGEIVPPIVDVALRLAGEVSSRPALDPGTSSTLDVALRRRDGVDVLEVSGPSGGVLGHFDPATERLYVIDAEDSLAVAAAVAPYLLGTDQPLGEVSTRHLAGARRLWRLLEAAPFTWHRAVPLRDRLLLFYCPLARLVLDIVDDGELAIADEAPALEPLGLALALIPLRDLEQRPSVVAGWLSGICVQRAAVPLPTPEPGSARPASSQTVRGRRARRP
jgi:hypothetical protein